MGCSQSEQVEIPKGKFEVIEQREKINTKDSHVEGGNISSQASQSASKVLESPSPAKPRSTLRRQLSIVADKNSHLATMDSDFLYHLGLSKLDSTRFKDIKFVCLGGSNDRMTKFAYLLGAKLEINQKDVETVGCHKRYVIYKVGKVLICSHGMGGPSISILLNEIAKLLKYAEADSCWIRLGTCGGVGLEPGTLAISSAALNGAIQPYHQTYVLGKPVQRPAVFDSKLGNDLKELCDELGYPSELGKTMCCDDFYEGQGRLDGAICEYTLEDKMKFLQDAHAAGVRNIEMESLQFGAFTQHVGIRAVCIATCLLNRLNGDQVTSTPAELGEFEKRAVNAVIGFVSQELKKQAEEEGSDSEIEVLDDAAFNAKVEQEV